MQIAPTLLADNDDLRRYAGSICEILDGNTLCTMATITRVGGPHANTAYYATDEFLRLFVLTPPRTRHSLNVATNPEVAVTVFDSRQPWDGPHVGLQLFGKCTIAKEGEAAFRTYSRRHPEVLVLADSIKSLMADLESRFYSIEIDRLRLVDERRYGPETGFEIAIER